MKQFFLNKIRLTYYYPTLFLLFLVIIWLAPTVPLNGPQAALLCTGLSLLFIILAKLATLTHKKAKPIWQPFERLLETNFKHIDQ